MHVLLIDDDPNVRKTLAKMLQRAGHEVTEGENGLQGIAQLRTAAVDLVLTDIVMPMMNGIEFIKEARQLTPSLKVIAMSGGGRTDNMDYLQIAAELGADATLHKPFTFADLQSSIDQCCGVAA